MEINNLWQVENGDGGKQADKFENDVEVGDGIRLADCGTDFRRKRQYYIDYQVPEWDQGDEIVRLVRPIHAQTYHNRHQIHAE